MKVLALLSLFALLVFVKALTDEQKEKLKRHHSQCIAESGADPTAVLNMRGGDYKTESDALKKFSLCVLIKSELMTKEGKFKKDIALAKIPVESDRPNVEKIIDYCLSMKGNTPEQTAWNFVKCYHEKNPKHPIM